MAVRGSAVHKNHNPTLYIYSVISPLTIHNGFLSGPYLEIELGTCIYVNKRKCRRQET